MKFLYVILGLILAACSPPAGSVAGDAAPSQATLVDERFDTLLEALSTTGGRRNRITFCITTNRLGKTTEENEVLTDIQSRALAWYDDRLNHGLTPGVATIPLLSFSDVTSGAWSNVNSAITFPGAIGDLPVGNVSGCPRPYTASPAPAWVGNSFSGNTFAGTPLTDASHSDTSWVKNVSSTNFSFLEVSYEQSIAFNVVEPNYYNSGNNTSGRYFTVNPDIYNLASSNEKDNLVEAAMFKAYGAGYRATSTGCLRGGLKPGNCEDGDWLRLFNAWVGTPAAWSYSSGVPGGSWYPVPGF